jgi:hypothetical protein
MNLVESMPRRMEAVKRARGGSSNANTVQIMQFFIKLTFF